MYPYKDMTRRRCGAEIGDSGAALVIALVFVVALGAIIAVLTSLSGTNLIETAQLQGLRNTEYAASSATDSAMQVLRYISGSAGGASGVNTYQPCETFPSSTASWDPNSTTSPGLTLKEDLTSETVSVACFAFPTVSSITGVSTSSGPNATTLTSTTANAFGAADVGQEIEAFGIPAGTTILSVQSGTQATISQAATANQSNITVTVQTPFGQRLIFLEACIGTISLPPAQIPSPPASACGAGSPAVEAIVRYFDFKSGGSTFQAGTGITLQSWVPETANH